MIKNLAVNINYCCIKFEGENENQDLTQYVNFNIQDEFIYPDTGKVSFVGRGQGTVFLNFLKEYTTLRFSKIIDENDPILKRLTNIIQKYFLIRNPQELWFLISLIFRGFELGDIGFKNSNSVNSFKVSQFMRLWDGNIILTTGRPYSEITEQMISEIPAGWDKQLINLNHPDLVALREEMRHRLETKFKPEDAHSRPQSLEEVLKSNEKLFYETILASLKPKTLAFGISASMNCGLASQLHALYCDMLDEFDKSGISSPEIRAFLEYSKRFFLI